MEANGACTLPEITSSPLKIKCCTHILILLPRWSIYISNRAKVKLQSGMRRLNSEQRLVWKAMRHVRLYSADFVICSSPYRKKDVMYSCCICLQTFSHRTWGLEREMAEIEKWTLPMFYSVQPVTWESAGRESSREAKSEASRAVWRPNPNTVTMEEVRPEALDYSVLFSHRSIADRVEGRFYCLAFYTCRQIADIAVISSVTLNDVFHFCARSP